MTITRPRKARILEKAGLRYVAGWMDESHAQAVEDQIAAAKARVDDALANAG